MNQQPNKITYNPRDMYFLVFKDTKKIYEKFRNKYTAHRYLFGNPLKHDLEIIKNPKYQNDTEKTD